MNSKRDELAEKYELGQRSWILTQYDDRDVRKGFKHGWDACIAHLEIPLHHLDLIQKLKNAQQEHLTTIEQLKDKNTKLQAYIEHIASRYRALGKANEEPSRNDRVTFDQLLSERSSLAEECDALQVAFIMDDIDAYERARAIRAKREGK